jgi:hypothetical protein
MQDYALAVLSKVLDRFNRSEHPLFLAIDTGLFSMFTVVRNWGAFCFAHPMDNKKTWNTPRVGTDPQAFVLRGGGIHLLGGPRLSTPSAYPVTVGTSKREARVTRGHS